MRLPQSLSRALSFRSLQSLIAITALVLSFAPRDAAAQTYQLSCNPRNVRFGTMVLQQQETVSVSLANSGSNSVTISAVSSSSPEFAVANFTLPFTLAAGQSVNLNMTFTPTVAGWAEGTIAFTSNASNTTLYVGVGGVGIVNESLTPSPAALSFGNVSVGKTSTLPVSVTNSGASNLRLTQMEMTGSGFTTSGLNLPMVLAPNQTLTFNVIFSPQTGGAASGSVILPNGGVTIPLTGTGTTAIGQLSIAPAPLNFGNVTVGNTGTQSIIASATGAPVTITSAASSSSLFGLEGVSFPMTIAVGGSVTLNVGFTPQTGGAASGSLSFASNASNPPGPESLTGTGVMPTYTVNLSWSPATEVVGYNVYRSTAVNGTYSKINSTLDPNTAYTDGSVTSGQTYYYAATSVNSSGAESGKSAPPVAAVVP
jgi:hypothetical protein